MCIRDSSTYYFIIECEECDPIIKNCVIQDMGIDYHADGYRPELMFPPEHPTPTFAIKRKYLYNYRFHMRFVEQVYMDFYTL